MYTSFMCIQMQVNFYVNPLNRDFCKGNKNEQTCAHFLVICRRLQLRFSLDLFTLLFVPMSGVELCHKCYMMDVLCLYDLVFTSLGTEFCDSFVGNKYDDL